MSDNNACPICEGYDSTAGIVHAPGCPNNKPVTWIFPDSCNPQAEIARLKAELKNGWELLAYAMAEAEGDRLKAALEQANIERDDARKWARRMYHNWILLQARDEVENG